MQTNIFDYLEYTAKRVPDKAALADEKGAVTFKELYDKALSVGTKVAEAVRLPDLPPYCRSVCVMTSRTCASVLGFMAALASGNFYVPVDKTMPKARMAKVFEKLDPAAVIGTAEELDAVKVLCPGAALIDIDEAVKTGADPGALKARRELVLDVDPAYVFFTSGSTGQPKGIAVSHGNLIDFTEWYTEEFQSSESDVCGNQPPFYFDASGRDLFPCLKTGGTIHILSNKLFMFPALLIKYMNENGINVLNWATSAFNIVANSRILEKQQPKYLKRIVLGGEALQAAQIAVWKKAVPGAEIINVYGPTETTVDCAFYRVDREFAPGEAVPIGKPCKNMQLLVIGEDGRPVKKGEAGELCVRGRGVSNGYYGDFEKSGEAFVQSPVNPYWHDRVYKTGDIVKMGDDGNLYFLSRQDNQIKHMGYRIELGETETALSSVEGVDEAVCLFDSARDKIVCVYSGTAEGDMIAKDIAKLVPRYMCPNIYRKLDRLPRNANGKADRQALKKEFIDG